MKFGSLFAGIGGFDLGLERAGMECAWQVEIDPFCLKVLEKHWPTVRRYTDVREVGVRNLEPVDLICGGFPCQDVSRCGYMEGIEGERSGLWGEFRRIICELRPYYAVVENVAGLLDGGIGRVLGDLAEIGYDAEWNCIPAYAVGRPHTRERIFIVAYPAGVHVEKPQVVGSQNLQRKLGRAWPDGGGPVHEGETDQPPFSGMADGVPERMDNRAYVERSKGIGNAVVPQVVEIIGRAIMEAERNSR